MASSKTSTPTMDSKRQQDDQVQACHDVDPGPGVSVPVVSTNLEVDANIGTGSSILDGQKSSSFKNTIKDVPKEHFLAEEDPSNYEELADQVFVQGENLAQNFNRGRKTPPGIKVRMKTMLSENQANKALLPESDQLNSVAVDRFVEGCGCLRSDLRPKVLRVIFLVVVALALILCSVIVKFSVFKENEIEASEGDMIILPTSTYFCKSISVTVESNNQPINVYVLPQLPEISKTRKEYAVGRKFVIGSWTYQFWALHLIKHTTLDIGICADQYIMFYVIKGEKNFTLWRQTTLFNNYFRTIKILPIQHCTVKTDFSWLHLNVRDTDIYYIMFSSSVGWRFVTTVSTYINFNRTIYNFSNSKQICQNNATRKNQCNLPLDYRSTDVTLVEFKPSLGQIPDPFNKPKIRWHPQPREKFYVIIFSGIYGGVFVLTILYTLWRFLVHRIKKRKETLPLISYDRTYYQHKAQNKGRNRKESPWVVCVSDQSRDEDVDQTFSLLGDNYEIENGHGSPEKNVYETERTIPAEFITNVGYTQTQQAVDASMTIAGISAI